MWWDGCVLAHSWWRHQMETFSALLAISAGNSSVTGEFPAQRPVTRSFDVFFVICARINSWVNNGEAGNLRHHRTNYDVIVMGNIDRSPAERIVYTNARLTKCIYLLNCVSLYTVMVCVAKQNAWCVLHVFSTIHNIGVCYSKTSYYSKYQMGIHENDTSIFFQIRELRYIYCAIYAWNIRNTFQCCRNESDGVSNYHRLECLLNRLFRGRSKKTSKFRVTGICEGNSQVFGEFPAQRASNAKNFIIWWRHHDAQNRYTVKPA